MILGFVVVSGLPASGKSTLALGLAEVLGAPLLDKDDFLEALFPTKGVDGEAARRLLSRQADADFQHAAMALPGAVLTSWWRHPSSISSSGTPVDWLTSLASPVVEVHCRCSAAVAASRFMARSRHPGHLDDFRTNAELLDTFTRQALLGPLGLKHCYIVDTELNTEPERISKAVVQMLAVGASIAY